MQQDETHMTLPEVMAALRVSRGVALAMLRRGDLTGFKTSDTQQGHWRVSTASYETFIAPERQAS